MMGTLKALKAVVLNGWPRMGEWRGEVLRGVVGAWVRVVDAEEEVRGVKEVVGGGLEELKIEMMEVVAVLKCLVEGQGVEWERECGMLITAEPKLEGCLLRFRM